VHSLAPPEGEDAGAAPPQMSSMRPTTTGSENIGGKMPTKLVADARRRHAVVSCVAVGGGRRLHGRHLLRRGWRRAADTRPSSPASRLAAAGGGVTAEARLRLEAVRVHSLAPSEEDNAGAAPSQMSSMRPTATGSENIGGKMPTRLVVDARRRHSVVSCVAVGGGQRLHGRHLLRRGWRRATDTRSSSPASPLASDGRVTAKARRRKAEAGGRACVEEEEIGGKIVPIVWAEFAETEV
ncbi:global transcription factor group E8, partial [Striga asiatica]